MNNIKIINFYTDDNFYTKSAKQLEASCISFNLNYVFQKINSKGSWVNNCGFKANFILEKLLEQKENDCIVWLDADSQVIKYPELFFSTNNDFGIRAEAGGKTKKPAKRETINLPAKWPASLSPRWFNSGTIFLRNVPSVVSLVNEWIRLQTGTNKWDQWTLQEAWANVQPKTEWLPREYCQIKKLHKERGAVILHELASVLQKVNRT